jgi:hypothetical protein
MFKIPIDHMAADSPKGKLQAALPHDGCSTARFATVLHSLFGLSHSTYLQRQYVTG